ncbi:MAG: hypothetical protein QOI57_3040 [Rubrobacteraceae bacterium]|nr:hypothetical protein [Rubrobacteraceae bacterium]
MAAKIQPGGVINNHGLPVLTGGSVSFRECQEAAIRSRSSVISFAPVPKTTLFGIDEMVGESPFCEQTSPHKRYTYASSAWRN